MFSDVLKDRITFFSFLRPTAGAGYGRKILKKIPAVFLSSAQPPSYFSLSFVECESSNRVFYDIFESSNHGFSTLKLTAGAGYRWKIPKKNPDFTPNTFNYRVNFR